MTEGQDHYISLKRQPNESEEEQFARLGREICSICEKRTCQHRDKPFRGKDESG